jgi:acyl-CoA synthetase (AMP-forming)/AMP-acid ligase II
MVESGRMRAARGWVLDRLARFGDRTALTSDDSISTFADIRHRVGAWEARFDAAGVGRQIVILGGDHSDASVGALFALFLRGAITVPVHRADRQRILEVADLCGATAIVDAASGVVTPVTCSGLPHPLVTELFASDGAGLVLLSSGSTGTPKAMLLSVDRLLERERLRTTFSPMVTAAFLRFDHIGGFNTLVHTLLTGGTLVTLSSRDAEDVCRQIERHRIELLPATPTFLNMLLIGEAHKGVDLSSLKLITYGTEVMPPSTLSALTAALPGVMFKQTYGLSETGILATKSRANDSVWMKLGPGTAAKVVDGVLWVKTSSAMLGYLNAPSPFDADGWLCTGDSVDVDGDYIRVHGRREEIINVGGLKVFPAEVEDQLLRAPFVNDAVVWAKKNPVTGFIVAASIAMSAGVDRQDARHRILAHCRAHLDDFKVPRFIEFVDGPLHTERFKKAKAARND